MTDPESTVVLKLGGSVITEKDQPETLDEAALGRAVDALATDRPARLVLVHGGGSFGHHHASEHGVSTTVGTTDAAAVTAIHDAMTRLNRAVVERLQAAEIPAVPIRPLSVATRGADGTLTFPPEPIQQLLAEGFVPVVHGDVVVHADMGATILSGDTIAARLGAQLDTDRIGICSSVPGVLDDTGAVIDRITTLETVADVLGASDTTDVSGGMAGKVDTLLAAKVTASIFGLDTLAAFLAGERPGTTVRPPPLEGS